MEGRTSALLRLVTESRRLSMEGEREESKGGSGIY
jgi:hypothetical protein